MKKKNNVSNIYRAGFKGLFSIYPTKNMLKSFIFPASATIVFIIFFIKGQKEPIDFIIKLSNHIISILPSLIGFILTGYALIIGLTETTTIKAMSKKDQSSKPSLFQIVSSTFAFVLISLSVILLLSISISIIVDLNLFVPDCIEKMINCYSINLIALAMLFFFVFYSINATIDIIINIFSFGQFVHSRNHAENLRDQK